MGNSEKRHVRLRLTGPRTNGLPDQVRWLFSTSSKPGVYIDLPTQRSNTGTITQYTGHLSVGGASGGYSLYGPLFQAGTLPVPTPDAVSLQQEIVDRTCVLEPDPDRMFRATNRAYCTRSAVGSDKPGRPRTLRSQRSRCAACAEPGLKSSLGRGRPGLPYVRVRVRGSGHAIVTAWREAALAGRAPRDQAPSGLAECARVGGAAGGLALQHHPVLGGALAR